LISSTSFWEETKLTPRERKNRDTDWFQNWYHVAEGHHRHECARPFLRPKVEKRGIEEGSISWSEGYLYYSWKFTKIARRQLKKQPPVLRDWMFFKSTDSQKRRFHTDRDIELLVPLDDLIKAGVVIG